MARCISAPTRSRWRRSPTPSAISKTATGSSSPATAASVHDARRRGRPARDHQVERVGLHWSTRRNHRHFMAKEIHEQPEVVGHTLAHYVDMANERVALPLKLPFDFKDIQRVSITACGTACYAGSSRNTGSSACARLPVEVDVASEFRYREAPLRKGDLAIFISQSGETADTLAALRYAKSQGAHARRSSTCRPRPSRARATSCCRRWPGRKSASPRPRPSRAS